MWQVTFRPEDVVVHVIVAAVDLPAGAERLDPVGIFVDDAEMVVDVAGFGAGAGLPAADPGATHGRLVAHRPGDFVQTVDVLLDVEVAREPGETVPVAELKLHVGPVRPVAGIS